MKEKCRLHTQMFLQTIIDKTILSCIGCGVWGGSPLMFLLLSFIKIYFFL